MQISQNAFYDAKRLFNRVSTDENKLMFLNARNHLCYVKRRAKRLFFDKEKSRLARISKSSPRDFWKYIKKQL